MKKMPNWLIWLLGLAALVALGLALAWLVRIVMKGTTVGQKVPSTSIPTSEMITTTPQLTPVAAPSATWEASSPTRIIYAVQPPGEGVTLWEMDYTPLGGVTAERKLTASTISIAGWRLQEISVSPTGQYVALNLRGVVDDWEGGVSMMELGTGQSIKLPGLHNHGLALLDWFPATNRILVAASDGTFVSTMAPDGSGAQDLPYHMFQDGAVSPDGRQFVLSALEETTFWFVSIDGTLTENVPVPDKAAGGGAPYSLAWSPDGQKLAYFDNFGNEMSQVRVIDADGSHLKYLSSKDAHNISPVWSEDSTTLVYLQEITPGIIHWDGGDPTAWNSSLWIAEIEAEQYRELVHSQGKACWSAAWLPGGSGVVFVSNRAGQSDVWGVNRDGSGLQQLTTRGNVVALDLHH